MTRQEEVVKERLKKIDELLASGVNPYPYSYEKKDNCKNLQEKHKKLKADKKTSSKVKIAGRIRTLRDLGKLIFSDLVDESGKIQLQLQEPDTSKKVLEFFKKFIDVGDFVGIEGKILRTKRGELSIMVDKAEILTKSLLPLPDKWHGLTDKEERYRKRYLDLIMNPEVRDVFTKRSQIIDAIRELLKKKGFLEVDTPCLQTIYGGAAAKPFKTKLNALDIELFLSISPELYLKRLIVGGYEKVFTIARNFRNEGIDKWHNPEFSLMEIYQAYADYNDMMALTEEIYEYVCKKVLKTTKIKVQGQEVDFKRPWKRMTMAQSIKQFAGIDILKMNQEDLKEFTDKNHVESKSDSWGMLVQSVFEHFCEKKLIQPTIITDHPAETTPLCKAHRKDERLIERFEAFCLGSELCNAYSELNDPVRQKILLEMQAQELKKGNDESNPMDEDFINALEIGMPPTGGVGIGVDRMIILLLGQESIRDVIAFPFMKPMKEDEDDKL